MATAELAVAMPTVLLVLGLGLSALSAGVDQIRCVDAARATARLAARGEADHRAVSAGHRLAPSGSTISLSTGPAEVSVTVTAPPAAGMRWLGLTLRPSASGVAAREDALPEGGP